MLDNRCQPCLSNNNLHICHWVCRNCTFPRQYKSLHLHTFYDMPPATPHPSKLYYWLCMAIRIPFLETRQERTMQHSKSRRHHRQLQAGLGLPY